MSGAALLWVDLVRVISRLMSDDTGDGDWFPMATAPRSRTGGFGCNSCGWLYCVTRGAGLVAPPISGRGLTVVLNQRGVVISGLCKLSRHQ